jgi:F-type H+-transporting ATPase subunit b
MDFVFSSFIYAILAFVILYVLLNKYAFGPLVAMMEKRRLNIQDQMSQAEHSRTEAASLLEQQKQALEDTRKEAYGILEQARVMSNKQSSDAIAAAKEDAGRIKKEALQEIENEKNKAVTQLRTEVSTLSVLIASKIIDKQVDEKSQEQLIEQYLKEVGDQS